MSVKNKIFFLAAFAAVLMLGTMGMSSAATVVQDTYIKQKDVPGTRKVNFADFDLNHDGRLSRDEVGEELFYIFDTDGNEVIDNIEYVRPMVVTIIPMEKSETLSVDFNDDGVADEKSFDSEEFIQKSMLYKFDRNKNGLSAKDFLEQAYWREIDDNNDKTIDLKEWKAAYIASLLPSSANPNRYNP